MSTKTPSSTQQPDQYSYRRPSQTATRALVDSTTHRPTSQSGIATPSDPEAPHATLHRRKTNNYEAALADSLRATIEQQNHQVDPDAPGSTGGVPAAVVDGVAYKGDAAASRTPQAAVTTATAQAGETQAHGGESARPEIVNVLGRQQSWKMADQKRANMERLLGDAATLDKPKGGYTSVAGGSSQAV